MQCGVTSGAATTADVPACAYRLLQSREYRTVRMTLPAS